MKDHRKQVSRVLLFLMAITLASGRLCRNCVGDCDEDTGLCSGNCNPGWDGPTCSRRNVAFKQNTTQSSNYKSYSSSFAVDGGTGHHFQEAPPTCSHTMRYPQPAFWTVTLDGQYNICSFRIYNRNENFCGGQCGARLNGFILSVGNSSTQSYKVCYQDNTTDPDGPGAIIDGVCNVNGPVLGDTVRIMISNSRPLSLCEVQIFVSELSVNSPDYTGVIIGCSVGISVVLITVIIIVVITRKIPRNVQIDGAVSSHPNSTPSQVSTISSEVLVRGQMPEPSSLYDTCNANSYEDHSYEAIRHHANLDYER